MGFVVDYVTVLGLFTGALTVAAFLPQLLKVWRTKSTRDISLGMFSVFCTATFLWIVYGVLINNVAVIVTNILVIVQALILVAFKIKYH
ncbi:MAG TPA: SemiSWEET transporter [Candidatus Acidoferrum sp.]|nr:SemiSWEET transporter [Candidatus Acidoferrum sp.]